MPVVLEKFNVILKKLTALLLLYTIRGGLTLVVIRVMNKIESTFCFEDHKNSFINKFGSMVG